MIKRLVAHRRAVQLALALVVFALVYLDHVTILQVLVAGSAVGLVFGKVFCRWMCPMGLLTETLLRVGPARNAQLYQYHKLGCPIAWVSGLLNRVSLLRIRREPDSCRACGKCDQVCYVTAIDKTVSHYRPPLASPTTRYTCSRCLECVRACPTGSLQLRA